MPTNPKLLRLKQILDRRFGLVFGGVMVLVSVAMPVLFLWIATLHFGQWSFDEVSRVPKSDANIDAVLVETNGGATTSFGYEVFLLVRGQKPTRSDQPVVTLYGAVRNRQAFGANLRWLNDTVFVEYLEAQQANWRNGWMEIEGRKINIAMKSGVNDSTAPPGGMLYNLLGRPDSDR